MRIAVVTTSFLPQVGGAEFTVHHLAQQWALQGHEVVVLNNSSDRVVHDEARYAVRRYPLARGTFRWGYHRRPFIWYESFHLRRALAELRPEFISAHFGYPTAIWLSRVRPLPRFLITCHGPAIDESEHGPRRRYGIDPLLAGAVNASHRAVAISTHAREVMQGFGVAPEKIVVIPNGADLERFRRPANGFDLRGRLGLPAGCPLVLSVGRESWEKGYESAIRAFAELSRIRPGVFYAMVGKGTERWRELAETLQVADRLRFCEGLFGDELAGAYQQADVFFSSSVSEVCPLVVAEAMAAGLPEVVTDVSGSQDMVVHGHNGFVVPPGQPEAMARALGQVLADDPLRERMGQASHARSRDYGWDEISRRYLDHA